MHLQYLKYLVCLTGDLGRMDAEGYFWIVGRADDIIFYDS